MLKMFVKSVGLGVLLLVINGCVSGGSTHNEGSHYSYAFSVDTEGWRGGFSDYPKALETSLSLQFAHTLLPAPLDTSDGAVLLSGYNLGDELFMYMKHNIVGLDANTTYALHFTVAFASTIPESNTTGIREDATMKVGAVSYEPESILNESGYYTINIDKGNQTVGGKDMVVIGDLTNGTERETYALKTVANTTPLHVRTDENGSMWVIVGTDSGFAGDTTIFYNQVDITLEKISN